MDNRPIIPFEPKQLRAIVFDLDNTLVSSKMDFEWLRTQIGCPPSLDVLHYSNTIACPTQRASIQQKILDHEVEDAQASYTMPGCTALLQYIESQALHTAIITRNCLQAAQAKVDHNQLGITRIISREHYPPKPSPDALIALAKEWQIAPEALLYVGDYLYDIEAATNANMPSCLVTHGKNSPFVEQASVVVNHLHDLIGLLERT